MESNSTAFLIKIKLRQSLGRPSRSDFVQWEFIYSLISSGKIPSRDYIGAEIYFPKGNIHSAPIKIDSVIFSDIVWIDYYRNYRANPKDVDSLKKVRELAIGERLLRLFFFPGIFTRTQSGTMLCLSAETEAVRRDTPM